MGKSAFFRRIKLPTVCGLKEARPRLTGKRFNERYTIPTVKHSPSQMVWGLCPEMV